MLKIDANANIIDNTFKSQVDLTLSKTKSIFDSLVKISLENIEAYNKENDTYLIFIEHKLGDGEVFLFYEDDATEERILEFNDGKEKLSHFKSLSLSDNYEENVTLNIN